MSAVRKVLVAGAPSSAPSRRGEGVRDMALLSEVPAMEAGEIPVGRRGAKPAPRV